MSDDARSNHTKGRKQRPRILVVNNPGPEDSSSDERREPSQTQPTPFDYRLRPLPSPSNAISADRSQGASSSTAPPPDQRHCYPSSRSNPSNPALSSPSSASSPALESTPPPSTPGLSVHADDLGEGTIRQDTAVVPSSDRNDGVSSHASRPAKLLANIRSHMSHGRRPSNNSRPPNSPTIPTPDSYAPHANQLPTLNPHEKITVLVTSDADSFALVDISGAMTPAFIRERIFSKLQIADDDQPRYSIYRTEVGKFAIGEALTDEQLFDLYREQGDEIGSLKLMVSHSSAAVHELSRDPARVSPTVNTITPPVLPQHNLYAPLRPMRRSPSRPRSQSSASEVLPPEVNTGYDASVSDDMEVDRDTRRSTMRPPPRPVGAPHRPGSPIGAASPEHLFVQGGSESPTIRPDSQRGGYYHTIPSVPISISPQKHQHFEHQTRYPSALSPDNVINDKFISQNKARLDSPERPRRVTPEREGGDKQEKDRSRRKEAPRKDSGSHRGKIYHDGPEDWTMVASNLPTSAYKPGRPITPQEALSPSSSSSSRYPPRYANSSGNSRSSKRPAGQAVPMNWAVNYKEPGKGDQKPLRSPSGPAMRMFSPKSIPDLRSKYNQQSSGHPASLIPGRSRQVEPPLPMSNRPSTSNSPSSNIAIGHTASSASDASAAYLDNGRDVYAHRSPDSQRTVMSPTMYPAPRSTPVHSPGQLVGAGQLGTMSPSTLDPIQRPRSALDERANAEYRQRPYHSPRGSENNPENNFPRSPPAAPVYANGSVPIQSCVVREDGSHALSRHPHIEQRSDIVFPTSSPSRQITRGPRTPPGSPIASPPTHYHIRNQETRTAVVPPATRDASVIPNADHVDEQQSTSELTLRRDENAWWAGLVDENAMESTVMKPKAPPAKAPLPPPPAPHMYSSSNATVEALVDCIRAEVEEDSESDEGLDEGLWAKKPKSSSRPPLAPLSIEKSPSSNQMLSSHNMSKAAPPNFPPPPDFIPPPPHPRVLKRPQATSGSSHKGQDVRASRFENEYDYTWAPRPPPEAVLERLEEYFPEHDLDRPVIEMHSGGSSPTSAENPVPIPHKSRHKKSIRHVAEEHKNRIDRTSRMQATPVTAALRKRNTKLWGSKLEEVTTEQAQTGVPPLPDDSSPGGTAKPIFHWVRGELIGKGTYGRVYLALNATTGEMIAVKQVEMPHTASDKDDSRQVTVVEALKLESETLKDLDHPNIVQYLGFEETPTFLSIFLEYVPGGSIASCLRKHGKFDEEVTKSFTGQILDGLEYLHGKGILHRDLKADNILVETSGVCKISDFGISKRTDDINMAGAYTSMQGTVFWMAPEVINSQQRGYNSKIDIWSVGCVVYEMWTGQRPWSGQEAIPVLLHLYQTKQGPPVPAEVSLSPLADDFRQKCFAMDPDERPTAAVLRKHPYLELQPGWTFNGFK